MSEDKIKNNPSFQKLKQTAGEMNTLKKLWPFLKPFAKISGVDTKSIDENLAKLDSLTKQFEEMAAIPDRYNELFSDMGWISFESMDLEAAREAIRIAEKDGLEQADEFLANYFCPNWVETRINLLEYINGFQPRFDMAKKALEDYKAGRFYASVLVTLALIDGWVSELNIVDFRRLGFFAEKSELVAWDSMAAHPTGLMNLKRVFSTSRLATRTETITIPHRHGIMHGMDLGYDNKFVAAKCWAALFAVREWAIKVAKQELKPPELEPQKERTLWESIESFRKVHEETELLKRWQPRRVVIGETVPPFGDVQAYSKDTPEQKMVEFLGYWLKKNYGFMANCFAPMEQMKPIDVRTYFKNFRLLEYELLHVSDFISYITDIEVNVKLKKGENVINSKYEFRLICNTKDGKLAYIKNDETVWGITTWRLVS